MKEYNDILILADGMITTAIKEFKDGKQWTDIVPIISENMDKAVEAVKDISAVKTEWETETKACVLATSDFVIDQLFKIKGEATPAPIAFKETSEMVDAISAITSSVVEKVVGQGFKWTEILEALTENINKIATAVEGVSNIPAELNSDPKNYLKAIISAVVSIAFDIKDKLAAKPA